MNNSDNMSERLLGELRRRGYGDMVEDDPTLHNLQQRGGPNTSLRDAERYTNEAERIIQSIAGPEMQIDRTFLYGSNSNSNRGGTPQRQPVVNPNLNGNQHTTPQGTNFDFNSIPNNTERKELEETGESISYENKIKSQATENNESERNENHGISNGTNGGSNGNNVNGSEPVSRPRTINSMNLMGEDYTLLTWSGHGSVDVIGTYMVKTEVLERFGLEPRELYYNLNEMDDSVVDELNQLITRGEDVIKINSVDLDRVEL